MATIKIEPIEARSIGNSLVHVTGLQPTDFHCLVGLLFPDPVPIAWNSAGQSLVGQDTNLNMANDDLQALVKLAIQLGAKS